MNEIYVRKLVVLMIVAWTIINVLIFTISVDGRQPITEEVEEWCGDLFMVTEESEEGYVYSCTDDYGDD